MGPGQATPEISVDVPRDDPAAGASRRDGPRPPLWRVLLGPVLALVWPGRAAVILADASWPAAIAVLLGGLVVLSAEFIGLTLVHETRSVTWVPRPASTTTMPSGYEWEIQDRSVADVWREWRAVAIGGVVSPAELMLIAIVLSGALALAGVAWLNLPLVHRTGSVLRTFGRLLRGSGALLGPAIALTLLGGGTVVALYLRAGSPFGTAPELALMIALLVAGWALVLYLWRVAAGLAADEPEPPVPPRCEGCGYDLTHRPASGRCPECNLPLEASLDVAASRPGSAWEQCRGPVAWIATVRHILRHPRRFYRQTRLRGPSRPEVALAAWNYVALLCGAGAWAAVMLAVELARQWEFVEPTPVLWSLGLGALAILFGTLGCWLGHRVGAAVVATWWLARGGLSDFRWAARVIGWESSFLWVFAAYWGLFLTSIYLFDGWVSNALGVSYWTAIVPWLGLPPEPLAFVVGTAGLAAVWLWRYEVAYRRVRWNNG